MQTVVNDPRIIDEYHAHTDLMYIDMYTLTDGTVDLWLTSRITEDGQHLCLNKDVAALIKKGLH